MSSLARILLKRNLWLICFCYFCDYSPIISGNNCNLLLEHRHFLGFPLTQCLWVKCQALQCPWVICPANLGPCPTPASSCLNLEVSFCVLLPFLVLYCLVLCPSLAPCVNKVRVYTHKNKHTSTKWFFFDKRQINPHIFYLAFSYLLHEHYKRAQKIHSRTAKNNL